MPLMSFPWIFHEELGKVATGNQSAKLPTIAQEWHTNHNDFYTAI